MEPITTAIVAALGTGALVAAKDVATTAIKDAYQSLKNLLTGKSKTAEKPIAALEANPESQEERIALAKHLEAEGIGHQQDLAAAAQLLLDELEKLRDNETAAPLFDFDILKVARNLELTDIEALGTVFKGRNVEIDGDFIVKGVRQTDSSKKK